jgi:hypothetical protein
MRLEGLDRLKKNVFASSSMEPVTFRIDAECLNHYNGLGNSCDRTSFNIGKGMHSNITVAEDDAWMKQFQDNAFRRLLIVDDFIPEFINRKGREHIHIRFSVMGSNKIVSLR